MTEHELLQPASQPASPLLPPFVNSSSQFWVSVPRTDPAVAAE